MATTTIALRLLKINFQRHYLSSVSYVAHAKRTLIVSAQCRGRLSSIWRNGNYNYQSSYKSNISNRLLPTVGVVFCRYQSTVPDGDKLLQESASSVDLVANGDVSMSASAAEVIGDAVKSGSDINVHQSLAELGLGGYTPIGFLQNVMDTMHAYIGLPWWSAIILTTCILRTCTLPLVVMAYRNSAKMNNISPSVSRLTQKMRTASTTTEAAMYSNELQALLRKHGCRPFMSIVSPLIQVPVFVSFFIGLRRMTQAPVESMHDGGLFWFADLTLCDPYYILPVLSCISMLATLELGSEVGSRNTGLQQQAVMKSLKTVFRILAIVVLPITIKFPAAIFCYWLTSNTFSMLQMLIMRTASLRRVFGIPEMIQHEQPKDTNKEGFMDNFKTAYNSAKQRTIIEQQRKLREQTYKQSLKTGNTEELFKYNPRQRKRNVEK